MFTPELKKEIARQRVFEGKTIKALAEEYGVSVGSVSRWCSLYKEEVTEEGEVSDGDIVKLKDENIRLKKEIQELKIKNDLLREIINGLFSGISVDKDKVIDVHLK